MPRVAGTDPGTSSLDVLILEDGAPAGWRRFSPDEVKADPAAPVAWLASHGPFDLVAGPSGYGLPLVRGRDCTPRDLELLSLVRPDERGTGQGVAGFSKLVQAFCHSSLPVVFLPGVIHLPTVPGHRKINKIDIGTADKLCVAALALARHVEGSGVGADRATFCLVELGSAFNACLVVDAGRVVDGVGGTSGPPGWQSGGAWDGEVAYLMSPLRKDDLFRGGVESCPDRGQGVTLFRESLVKCVAGLRAVTPFDAIYLSGRLLEKEPEVARGVAADLTRFGSVTELSPIAAGPKHAAQGSALLADGLAGGRYAWLVDSLQLRKAAGTTVDWVRPPRVVP